MRLGITLLLFSKKLVLHSGEKGYLIASENFGKDAEKKDNIQQIL